MNVALLFPAHQKSLLHASTAAESELSDAQTDNKALKKCNAS